MSSPTNIDRVPTRELSRDEREPKIILVDPSSEDWSEAVELEAQTFVKRGFVGGPKELKAEYEAYEPKTSMLAVKAGEPHSEKVLACARVVEYDPAIGFKTIDDSLDEQTPLTIDKEGWGVLDPLNHMDMFEVGTISASPGAGPELFGAIIGYGLDAQQPRQYTIASLDEQVLEKRIKPLFGDSVQTLGPASDYLGSLTIPILIDLARAWDNIAANEQLKEIFARVAIGRERLKHGH